jgi:hypothetical protein
MGYFHTEIMIHFLVGVHPWSTQRLLNHCAEFMVGHLRRPDGVFGKSLHYSIYYRLHQILFLLK